MDTLISKSPEETVRIAADLARQAKPGWVIGLIGDLGAGKTQFAKGFAMGLGITDRVHSPTFTLVNEYRSGRIPCFHLDLYRLENPEQLAAAGLEPYFSPKDEITIIEWFDRGRELIPSSQQLVVVHFEAGPGENEREIRYEHPGT